MNLQADISWIQAELSKVRDPELITAFKSLLKYRKKQVGANNEKLTKSQFVADIKEAEAQIEQGDYLTIENFEKEASKW